MRRFLTPRLVLLAAGHFTIDAYSSFFSPLLPLLVVKLHLSLTLVGTLVALASLSSSFSQPLWGWLSDRLHRPWFVALGPLVSAVFMCSIGLAPNFATLVVLLMLGGLGVAAYHPQAAVLAGEASPRRSLAMSFFITGGTLGFALGPLFAVSVVERFGLEGSWVAVAPGVVMCAVLGAMSARLTPAAHGRGPRPALRELRPVARPLALLYLAVVSRSAVSYGFMIFLPIYVSQRHYSVAAGGALLTAYLTAGAIGGFIGGWLAERIGARRVVVLSFAGAIPLFVSFLVLPTAAALTCLVIGGFVLQGSLPVNVVLGQELSPRHSSTISSLLMGAAWGMGALVVGLIGALADTHGLMVGLACLEAMLVLGLACAMALPETRPIPAVAELAHPGAVGK